MKAIAVAVSNCAQWLFAQLSRSLSIRTVMPAEAQAAANVRVDVICRITYDQDKKTTEQGTDKKNSKCQELCI